MSISIKNAEFVAGSPGLESLPASQLPEIAMLGRSNAGKSTFINAITMRRKLARSSSTPGCTREINIFEVEVAAGKARSRKLVIADLPGFGFAKFARDKREELSEQIVRYIQERPGLKAICLLNDCRRSPQADELAVQELAFRSGRELIVVASKFDKLKKSEHKKHLQELAEAYSLPLESLLPGGMPDSFEKFWKRALAIV